MFPYISLDLETTGLNPETCQILEIAAIYDTGVGPLKDQPAFHALVEHGLYQGEPFALSMHQKIFRALALHEDRILTAVGAARALREWVSSLPPRVPNLVGKNPGFDLSFLRKMPGWVDIFCRRLMDPAVLYYKEGDLTLPNTDECLRRAGLAATESHRAMGDALDVCRLIRYKFGGEL